MNEVVLEFYECFRDKDLLRNIWNKRNQIDRLILSFFRDVDLDKFIKLLDDPFWNKYPSYRRYGIEENVFSLGPIIGQSVFKIIKCLPKLKEPLLKYSQGIWLKHTIDYVCGKERKDLIKRAINSSDQRVRLRASRFAEPNILKKRLKIEKDIRVKESIITRLGIDNCYEYFLNDDKKYLKLQAVFASKDENLMKDMIEESRKNIIEYLENQDEKIYYPYIDSRVLVDLLPEINRDEALYLMDIQGFSKDLDDILILRTNSKWG